MSVIKKYYKIGIITLFAAFTSCKMLAPVENVEKPELPLAFADSKDTINSGAIKWKSFFSDKNLQSLIDTALTNNIDLQMTLQDIEIARNDVRLKKGL